MYYVEKHGEKQFLVRTAKCETAIAFNNPEYAFIFCSWLNGGRYPDHQLRESDNARAKMENFWNELNSQVLE